MGESTIAAPDTSKGLVLSLPITKVDHERGEVWGVATTEALDQQGEIVDYEASKRAFAEWTSLFQRQSGGESLGNVREMHQPKVVGKLIAYHPDDETRRIMVGARINRETADGRDAWNKVINHELNGFSIGAPSAERVTEIRPEGIVRRVVGYKLAELSLVDNPACPEAFFTMVKSAGNAIQIDRHLIVPIEGDWSGVEKALWRPSTDAEREWVSEKIRLLIEEGKPRDQAVAIAHSMGKERFEGKTKEASMDAKVLAAQSDEILKAGKKIGPQHHEVADPPGAQKPKVEHVKSPEPPPRPAKSAGGGVPSDDGETVSVPEGQGKAAEADAAEAAMPPMKPIPPGGQTVPAHVDVPLPKDKDMGPTSLQPGVSPVPQRYGYCAYCGSKQSGDDGKEPMHRACQAEVAKAAMMRAGAEELLKSADLGGIAKAFRAHADALEGVSKVVGRLVADNAALAEANKALEKRIKAIEDQPVGVGPMRTELPHGVVPVEKAGPAQAAAKAASEDAILEKAVEMVKDPFLKDQLSRLHAQSLIKRTLASAK